MFRTNHTTVVACCIRRWRYSLKIVGQGHSDLLTSHYYLIAFSRACCLVDFSFSTWLQLHICADSPYLKRDHSHWDPWLNSCSFLSCPCLQQLVWDYVLGSETKQRSLCHCSVSCYFQMHLFLDFSIDH